MEIRAKRSAVVKVFPPMIMYRTAVDGAGDNFVEWGWWPSLLNHGPPHLGNPGLSHLFISPWGGVNCPSTVSTLPAPPSLACVPTGGNYRTKVRCCQGLPTNDHAPNSCTPTVALSHAASRLAYDSVSNWAPPSRWGSIASTANP